MGQARGNGVAFSPVDPKVVFAGSWRSVDAGWTFQPVFAGDPWGGGDLLGVLGDGSAVVASRQNDEKVYRVQATGEPQVLAKLSLALDRCYPAPNGGLVCLTQNDQYNGGGVEVWALAQGASKLVKGGKIPFVPRGFAVQRERLIATDIGVWVSYDHGATWAVFEGDD